MTNKNFHSSEYNIYKNLVEQRRDEYENDWNLILNFEFYSRFYTGEDAFEDFKFQMLKNDDPQIDYKTWQDLVNFLEKESKNKITTLLSRKSINDAHLPTNAYSQWKRYEKNLIQKNFSSDSITNIKEDAFNIMQQLNMDTRGTGPTKGLAIGDVQSGKTANMAAVMSMAADNGFNFFIILSGVIENLRIQTADRLLKDMDLNSHFNWTNIENPKVSERNPVNKWENINISENSKNKYFLVSLKNKSRLENLAKWLYSDKNKLEQLKILIIDDEADQASINTKDLEEEDRSTINKKILDLVNGVNGRKAKAVNYISYTGTPYANVLNEIGDDTLFPNDFIYTLTPSSDYLGANKIFGLEEPEAAPTLNLVRNISYVDFEQVQLIHKGESTTLPTSFQKSIDWFVLVSAIQRHYEFTKPLTMLIHTSLKIIDHEMVATVVKVYLESARKNRDVYFEKLKNLYDHESQEFTLHDFKDAMPSYSNIEGIREYPKWEDILVQLKALINVNSENYIDHIGLDEDSSLKYHKGFHLVIDNSRTKVDNQHVRLVYPSKKLPFAPLFIVIGGNTLSRGLTLEGLVSSYFIRQTKQADTLYQMGRWFGYRPQYELFPRVWMDTETKRKFEFITQLNTELIEEIDNMRVQGYLPIEAGVKIKNSPNNSFIRITSGNKMQSASVSEIDFSGFNRQTILFKNDLNILETNLNLTESFLNSLSNTDTSQSGKLIWRDVAYEQVRDYLKDMKFSDRDVAFSNMEAFFDWYDKTLEENELENWNVILSSKKKIKQFTENDSTWNIQGYAPQSVMRSRLGQPQKDGKTVSIGALRSPNDLISDITEPIALEDNVKNPSGIKSQQLRAKYGLKNVPQLVIYRIDKGEQTEEEFQQNRKATTDRHPLNFEADLIGINLMIPGSSKTKNLATKIQIKVTNQDEDDYISEEFD